MTAPPPHEPLPPGGAETTSPPPDPWEAFDRALANEARPFAVLADVPITAARWVEQSTWPHGERGDSRRGLRWVTVRYGDDHRWAEVGTHFGQLPEDEGSDQRRTAAIHEHMVSGLGLRAAEPRDGEASVDADRMWARIDAAEAEAAAAMTAGSLTIDGEPVDGFTAVVGDHRRTYVDVPVGGAVFLHTCRWDGPVELRRTLDYGDVRRSDMH